MHDDPGQELFELSSQEPGNPYAGHYHDPIQTLFLKLPFLSLERKQWLGGEWDNRKPANHIYAFLAWLEENDSNVLLLSRVLIAVSPIVLAKIGVTIEWIITAVAVSILAVEWFAGVRQTKLQERVIKQTKKEYFRQYERPRVNARRREAMRRVSEESMEEERGGGDDDMGGS